MPRISQKLIEKYTEEEIDKYIETLTTNLHSGDVNSFEFSEPEIIPPKHIKYQDKNKDIGVDVFMFVDHDSWNFKGSVHSKKLNKTFYLDKHLYGNFGEFNEALYRKLQEIKNQSKEQ